jgi:hypothetical protein
LIVLKHIKEENWPEIYKHIKTTQMKKFKGAYAIRKVKSLDTQVKPRVNVLTRTVSVADVGADARDKIKQKSSGILLTTADAHTLTDGPTIFLTEDVQKVGAFYIQQSNISPVTFQTIMARILKNGEVSNQIARLEASIEAEQDKLTSGGDGDNKADRLSNEAKEMLKEVNALRKEIHSVSLDPMYVPNTRQHQELWTPTGETNERAFVSNIDEETTRKIMSQNINNNLKVLLLLGIGMFMDKPDIKYMEVMKTLADNQKLFIIIASSDYIYGTNYAFCHGFIGKDLTNMTQQKTLQAMGRIGRNSIQQSYTVRFRDDDMIKALFQEPEVNREAINMRTLFTTD